MSCTMFTQKFYLFLLTLLSLIGALIIASVAVLMEYSFFEHTVLLDYKSYLESPPMMVAAACGIIAFISVIGCCGVVKENRFLLGVFSFFMLCLFCAEIFVVAYGMSNYDEYAKILSNKMEKSMINYQRNESITRSWDVLQGDFKCCGTRNASDWFDIGGQSNLPNSCCKALKDVSKFCSNDQAFKTGCYSLFRNFMHEKAFLLKVVAFFIGLAQLVGAALAAVVVCRLNPEPAPEF